MSAEAALAPVTSSQGRRPSRLPSWYRRREPLILGLAGVLGFLALWQLGSSVGLLDPFFFSSPTAIVEAGIAEVQLPRFWGDVQVSSLELAVGGLIALATAIPLGLAIGWYRRVGYMFDPWLNFFNSLPRVALLPLVVLWLGLGIETKMAVVFLGAFFAIIVPTAQGVKTVDRQLLDVGRSLKASQGRIFTTIVLPSTIPFIVAGIRLAIGRGLIGVVVAEFYAQTEGLGVMIIRAEQALNSDRMLFGVLIFTFAGVGLALATGALERRVQRWRPSLDLEETNS